MALAALLLALTAAALATANPPLMAKIGDGQCNGGVGGTGEHKCLIGGACNEGGTPTRDPTVTGPGSGCPGPQEYLLCVEDANITRETCKAACEADADCVGFLVSRHAYRGKGRCELHTKAVTYVAKALECYGYDNVSFTWIGKTGACRTKEVTINGPQNGTHYGDMQVAWVDSLEACEDACRASSRPCVGVEYHRTANSVGKFKCEVHFEELSADQMSTFECWAPPTCGNAARCGEADAPLQGVTDVPCMPAGGATTNEANLPSCTNACCQKTAETSGASRAPRLAAALGAAGLLALARRLP